eukprot:363309-Chlamydomonas_euryale.AAC.12
MRQGLEPSSNRCSCNACILCGGERRCWLKPSRVQSVASTLNGSAGEEGGKGGHGPPSCNSVRGAMQAPCALHAM